MLIKSWLEAKVRYGGGGGRRDLSHTLFEVNTSCGGGGSRERPLSHAFSTGCTNCSL